MPDLLLELFSEEIPARMQAGAVRDLERLVVGALTDRGLLFEAIRTFAGPRRLALAIAGLPARQSDVNEERKGPRVGAPEKAVEGFLRGAGVSLDQCVKQDDGKGEFYVAVIRREGRPTPEVLGEILPEAFAKLPWPKSMRFPRGGARRWVRPLHSILCTFDGEVVPFSFAGVTSGNTTFGHRFLSSGPIAARRFDDYSDALRKAHVVLDAGERKEIILHEAKQKVFALGLELIEDAGLLDEVAGLVEWPVVLVGRIEDAFMDVPPEILQTAMRTHQKYFSLRDPKSGKMANRFLLVANMAASDGGAQIVAGNERVLRARLSDAKFFWDEDRRTKLADRVGALNGITFHARLGTQHERIERIVALAGKIAHLIGADIVKVERAAHLCKADLTTGVVGEFPELQGVMGRYYALHDGEDPEVADAIRDHYKPAGPGDSVPANKISIAVALADKLDSLLGFLMVGLGPTGSGDPFALRRAALGCIRIWNANEVRLNLSAVLKEHAPLLEKVTGAVLTDGIVLQFLSFFAERLKVALKEKGTRHDLIDAVFSLGDEDDLVRLVARVEALQAFLKADDGANLLAGYKRAANILKAEEKKEGKAFGTVPLIAKDAPPEERSLAAALEGAQEKIRKLVPAEKFTDAMKVMAELRAPVDAFFDKVKVNDENPTVRRNRLELLSRLRETLHTVADFSKIEG